MHTYIICKENHNKPQLLMLPDVMCDSGRVAVSSERVNTKVASNFTASTWVVRVLKHQQVIQSHFITSTEGTWLTAWFNKKNWQTWIVGRHQLTVIVHHSGLLLAAVHREANDLHFHKGINDLTETRCLALRFCLILHLLWCCRTFQWLHLLPVS